MIKLETRNLNYSYNAGQAVLDDVSLEIRDGSITVLLGLNGSGKTTLIKILTGLLKPLKGTTFIDTKDITQISSKELSKLISYVPQSISDDTDFAVLDYLTFGRMNTIKFYASPKSEDYEKAKIIANELGITDLLHEKMNELSGGQRQLITIARSVVQDSGIIVMDEPTSSIDYKFLNTVIRYIYNLKKQDKTIVLSCHNPSIPLLLNADVVVLEHGKVKMTGKAREVLTLQNLCNIYGCDFIASNQLPYEEASLLPIENEIRIDNF